MQTLTRAVLITVLSVTVTISFGQKQKADSLTTVVEAIANSNIYEVTFTVGYAGTVSQHYQRFEQLISLATDQQLTDLATDNKNAVVRLYALQALKRKKVNVSDALKQQFQNDDTKVVILKGCICDIESVKVLARQNLKAPYDFSD